MTMSLRLPSEVHDGLTEAAKEEDRSLNAQIVYVLRQYLADRRAKNQETKG